MRCFIVLFFMVSLIFSGCVREKNTTSEFAELVKSEYAFAELSAKKGIKEAFVTYLADDAIVFRPRPLKGKPIYQARPVTAAQLKWWPIFANISSAGDLGYTTGPWQFKRDSSDAQPAAFGHFVSVWKKQADGLWRVVIDAGVSHPRPASKAAGIDPTTLPAMKSVSTAMLEMSAAELLEADRALAAAASANGFAQAFLQHAAEGVRYYREGAFPIVGKAAVQSVLADFSGGLNWAPLAGEVSRSGDLGYTYGIAQHQANTNGEISELSYLHIWKKKSGEPWRLLLEVMTPIPPQTSNSN